MVDISGDALMKTGTPVSYQMATAPRRGVGFHAPFLSSIGGLCLTGTSLEYAVASARLICATALLYLEVSMMLLTTFDSYNLAAPSSLKVSMGGDG